MTETDVVAGWEALRTTHRDWVMSHKAAVQYANSRSWMRRWVDRRWLCYGNWSVDASEIGCWAYDMDLRLPVDEASPQRRLIRDMAAWFDAQ